MHHSVTVVREEQEHDLISSPVSMLSARSAEHYDLHNNGLHFVTHWLQCSAGGCASAQEACALFLVLHVSVELCTPQNVGRNYMYES